MIREAFCRHCQRVVFCDSGGRCRRCKKPTSGLPKGWLTSAQRQIARSAPT